MKKIIYIFSFVLIFSSITTIQAQEYKTHRVQSGETIELIAKQYNVTPYDIYALNPDAKKELKQNAVLIIPKSKIAKPQTKTTTVKEFVNFREHKVKRKETLYSLAKKYNVEQDEIKKHNPSLYANNLRKGDKIKIPVYKTKTVVETVKTTSDYTVLPKEGKWRIAYKYGITVDELEALNPNMPATLNVGQVIQVPNLETAAVKEIDERYSYYSVLPKEGFYRLKIKLGLEQEELEALNPELKETGLKSGMVLKIPFSSKITETGESISGDIQTTTSSLISNIRNYETKNIAIMLPFRLNRVNADSVYDAKKQIENDNFLSTSLDFHSGVLMAVDSLKKLGISLKVDVYDTKNQLSEVSYLLNSKNIESADAVIGPLMPKNFERVASELKRNNVPVISPNLKDLKLSENVFQSMPSTALLKTKMIDFVKADSTKNHVIIIADAKNAATSNALKRELGTASQIHSRKDKEGKDSYYVLEEDIIAKLKPGKNIIFLETENFVFVSNVTSILNSLNNDENKIVLVTTDMNDAFENDEISNYHLSNLNFHFPTVSKTYNEDDNNGFAKQYSKKYGATPNKTAVRGFDLMMDVVLRLSASENIYNSVNEFPLTEYLENKFAYHKNLFGGYYNNTVYVVKYQDLKIVEAK
ncbi:LysM peptidoglycan-binding domain-containing protein [Oceanihabitans sp. 2_MG-2023]|uniref:LysM peptidoglycan-binding domain-containing protein n=1 Tax=Oceanihabitans sp. 2_MG-2023 TaxID=3062661 RepID=UPI0026E300A9|nr:LysM peptidoglycan-binding domain-containing protein [Oceanihabitans sp. 2_MG-2023]MDO6597636.1 LysM peptidoglycan-binding domain-containing protein [Oceanihabitans sp. 2_MG-2023]